MTSDLKQLLLQLQVGPQLRDAVLSLLSLPPSLLLALAQLLLPHLQVGPDRLQNQLQFLDTETHQNFCWRCRRPAGSVGGSTDPVVSLRLPAVLQRPLQVSLQPLQGPVLVLLSAVRPALSALGRLQLQLSLEQRRLQGQNLALTRSRLGTGQLRVGEGRRVS